MEKRSDIVETENKQNKHRKKLNGPMKTNGRISNFCTELEISSAHPPISISHSMFNASLSTVQDQAVRLSEDNGSF
jgi:hypothetical protein